MLKMIKDRFFVALATSALLACGETETLSTNPGEDLASPPDMATTPDLLPPPPPFDWIGIIGTGQSLSVGVSGTPVLSSTAGTTPHRKLAYSGPASCTPFDGRGTFSMVPLVEPIRAMAGCGTGGEYPDNIYGETPHTAFGKQLSALSAAAKGPELPTVHSVVGWSGRAIQFINKAGGAKGYPASISEGQQLKQAAMAAGKSFGYGAILLTHGESDTANAMYGAQVWQLAEDYNNDLRQLTGQVRDVPLFLSQQHSFPTGPGRSVSTVAQWKLGVDHPGRVICVGPKYQYPYATDKVHFLAAGYIQLGQKYAQVFYETVIRGVPWQPLSPTQVSRSGARITVKFHVPVPPLVFEDSLAPPHQTTNMQWKSGRGFEVEDSTGPLTILSATLQGDSVELVLDKAPTGMNLMVRYAMTQAATGAHAGDDQGRRGQLRDSDPFVGYDYEKRPCQVTMGSTDVTVTGALTGRAVMDWVSGANVSPGTRIAGLPAASRLTLSKPWTGATGTADLAFWHEQYNYAVAFELPVP